MAESMPALPDLTGRVAMVTGANGGIGYWTSLHLARAGAHVVMACRSVPRAEAALAEFRSAVPHGSFEVLTLDLADLASVRAAAKEYAAQHDRLDLLVNNAGIAMAPKARTVDGYESHLGANYLGHFALTGLLIDTIVATPGSRVVQVGSLAQHYGRFGFDDPHFDRRYYTAMRAYGQSKFANVVFMLELERRLRLARVDTISLGGHPGLAPTGIVEHSWIGKIPKIRPIVYSMEGRLLNARELGAVPSLLAATDPGLTGGSYLGPGGLLGALGPVGPARLSPRVRDQAVAARLWDLSEELTGVRYLD